MVRMIVGTIWCQRGNKWVRFVREDGVISAESARARKDNPFLAEDWQPEVEGIWSADFELGIPRQLKKAFYCLKEGVLYFSQPQRLVGGVQLSRYSAGEQRWAKHNSRTEGNPFVSMVQEEIEQELSYEDLPLTVEAQQEKWVAIQTNDDFFQQFIEGVESDFTSVQRAYLYNDLIREIPPDFKASNYATYSDFIGILSFLITDNENQFYKAIDRAAGATHTDRDLKLNPTNNELLRQQLYQQKKNFYLAVFSAGIKFVSNAFNQPEPMLDIPLELGAGAEAEVKKSIGIYAFFSGLLTAITQFIPNIFSWLKPARGVEKIAKVDNVDVVNEPHVIPVEKQHERGLGSVASPESSGWWFTGRNNNQSIKGWCSTLLPTFSMWSSAQPTGDEAQRHQAKPDGDTIRLV